MIKLLFQVTIKGARIIRINIHLVNPKKGFLHNFLFYVLLPSLQINTTISKLLKGI